jgi:predicted CXXCH cytochrome family protein
MRKIFGATLGLFLVAGLAGAQITGSAHDFTGETWMVTSEMCQPCHTPHNASTALPVVLWNHEVTVATYTLYNSPTMNATTGQPDGVSKACLSCHDGTVALDSFGGSTGGTTIGGTANFGTDLANDHPVSFAYTNTLATTDGGLHPPTSTASGITQSGTIAADMLFGTGNTQVECASCHDVHNAANLPFLLLKSNAGSALCLTCHNK